MRSISAVLLNLLVFVLMAAAQDTRNLEREKASVSQTEKRIALVIGNGAYTSAPSLKNPPNDARDMAATLKALGFDVTSGINVNQKTFKQLIREFGLKLKAGGSGLFYYAGHGVQSNGRNYLIPVDANIQSEAEVEDTSVDISLVLRFMDDAQNGLNIVILDACRNNPFAKSFRSATDGLAQIDAPTGTLIAYATAPGTVASDGADQNGLYTSELLKQMRVPSQSATDMFMNVRGEVMKKTAKKQVPWESSSLVGAFYFNREKAGSRELTREKGGITDLAQSRTADAAGFELTYWESIKDSSETLDYISYLEKHPKGQFVDLARRRAGSALSKAAEKHNKLGDDSFSNSRFVDAESEYRLAIYFDPTRSAFYENLVKTLDKLNKSTDAQAARRDAARAADDEKKEADRKTEAELREKIKSDPNSASAHGYLGGFFKSRERWEEAETAFRAAMRVPNYNDGYSYGDELVEVLLKQNKIADAETVLKDRLQRRSTGDFADDSDAFAYWKYAVFLKSQNRSTEAEAPMKEAARLNPGWTRDYADLLVELRKVKEADDVWQQFLRTEKGKGYLSSYASYLRDQKRWADAEAAYREVIKQKPTDASYHGYLAKALEEQKKIPEAEAEFREAVRLDSRYYRNDLIEFLIRQKNYADAEKQHRERVRLEPSADNHFYLANFLEKQKRFDEAETEFKEALRLGPTAYRFWLLGNLFRDQKKWKEAEAAYREGIRLDPNDKLCLEYLAQTLSAQKKFSEAETVLQDFVKRSPSGDSYRTLGFFLLNHERGADAEVIARQAIKLDPGSKQGYAVLNYIILGRSLAKQKKYTEAEAAFRESIRLEPIVGNSSIAEFYKDQESWPAAETAYREFLRLSPQSDHARGDFALVLQKTNKQDEALIEAKKAETYFRKSVITFSTNGAVRHALGNSLEIQNRLAEAETEYREAVSLDPDTAKYKEGLQRVLKAQGKEL